MAADAGIEYQWNDLSEESLSQTDDKFGDADIIIVSPYLLPEVIDRALTAGELGISESDMASQYNYTKTLGKNSYGETAAFTWVDMTGMFLYNRDIAKEVLGTDDPKKVQAAVGDWDSFLKAAKKMKKAGYYMYQSISETLPMFMETSPEAFINTDSSSGSSAFYQWFNTVNKHYDNGFTCELGDEFTYANCFGRFLVSNSNCSICSDNNYSACAAPMGYITGGFYMLVNPSSDNKAFAADIIKRLTCDKETMKTLAKYGCEFVNNKEVMNELKDDGSFTFVHEGYAGNIEREIKAAEELTMGKLSQDMGWQYSKLATNIYDISHQDENELDPSKLISRFMRNLKDSGKYDTWFYYYEDYFYEEY